MLLIMACKYMIHIHITAVHKAATDIRPYKLRHCKSCKRIFNMLEPRGCKRELVYKTDTRSTKTRLLQNKPDVIKQACKSLQKPIQVLNSKTMFYYNR